MFCNCFAVTGQHNALLHTGIFQGANRLLCAILDHIRDQDISGILSIHCYMNHCPYAGVFRISQIQALHQLRITGCHLPAVHLCRHAVSADFFHITDSGRLQFSAVDGLAVGALETLTDGMAGIAFRISGIFQQCFFRIVFLRINSGNFKHTFGQGSGFIKYNVLCLGQCLQIIGSLYQNTTGTCRSDSSEKA